MRVGKSSRQVADARVMATAHSVASLLHQSRDPMYTLGRILVLAGDALQSLPPPSATRPLTGSAAPPGAGPRPLRTR